MNVEKLTKQIEFAAMELRGYLTRIEKMAAEIESYATKCERPAENLGTTEVSSHKAALWEEASDMLHEATSEFPSLIQSLEDILSGVENAPTPLNEIVQISVAEVVARHDKKLASRSAFGP